MKTHTIKNNLIIWLGNKLTTKKLRELREKNRRLYGLRIDFYN